MVKRIHAQEVHTQSFIERASGKDAVEMSHPVIGKVHDMVRSMKGGTFSSNVLIQAAAQESIHQFQAPADTKSRHIMIPAVMEHHGFQFIPCRAHRSADRPFLFAIEGRRYILSAGKEEPVKVLCHVSKFLFCQMER